MKTGPFRYLIEVTVFFTGQEILALYEASQSHYDAKCKAAGRPRNLALPYGGEIWGLINRLPNAILIVPSETDEQQARRKCLANEDVGVEVSLNSNVLGTLGKIAEMPGRNPDEDKTLWGLRIGIKRALLSSNAEYTRLNCSPVD